MLPPEKLSAENAAKSDALRLIALRPRSTQELRDALKKKGHPESVIESALGFLAQKGMVNDEKFAKIIADSRLYAKPVGRRQLEEDLKKKGLTPQIVQKTMASFKDYDETAAATQLALNRVRSMRGLAPEKKKARLFGFLRRRGFSSDAVFRALSEALKKETISED